MSLNCKKRGCKRKILQDGLCELHARQVCPICMESVTSCNTSKAKRLSCGHAFHVSCILPWFQESDNCPTCRKAQDTDPIIQFKKYVEDKIRNKYLELIDD